VLSLTDIRASLGLLFRCRAHAPACRHARNGQRDENGDCDDSEHEAHHAATRSKSMETV
jgi:hypothetical protein